MVFEGSCVVYSTVLVQHGILKPMSCLVSEFSTQIFIIIWNVLIPNFDIDLFDAEWVNTLGVGDHVLTERIRLALQILEWDLKVDVFNKHHTTNVLLFEFGVV